MMSSTFVNSKSCKVSRITEKINIDRCYYDYGLFNQEKSEFDEYWTRKNPNITSNKYSEYFQYKSSDELETYPYLGQYYNFYGGGYVYFLDIGKNSLEQIQTDLENLEKLSWIDAHTRGVFYEFQVYNPYLNLFAYCTILLEIIPTGKIIKTIFFEPVILFEPSNSFAAFIIAINIIFLIFTIFFMIKEIRLIIKQKLDYLKNFWNYVEWTIFVFTWFTFSMYLYRLYAKEDLIDKIKSHKEKVIKLQMVCYWNGMMSVCLGFLSFLGTLKFLKLLRFNRSIKEFMVTMRLCGNDLINFSLLFLFIWGAFSQLIYLEMHDKAKSFSTIISTFESTFLMTLNKLYKEIYVERDSLLISVVTIFFYIVVVFSLLSIFITIITDNFSKSARATDSDEEGLLVAEFLKEKFLDYFGKNGKIENRKKKHTSSQNNQNIDEYEKKFINIIENIDLKLK
ncbi:polycystic kidney disease 1-like 2 [Brachionus plicatilis]|uniref:Polycystic kidney disease 1-like 2 n=1 Tax=Brachionus plicatilis TaxID=10195 RepID=A0A3M7QW57_BRAPC|nr:polycystic kidney disease 1-like 2 [Brachionus plicatilis]